MIKKIIILFIFLFTFVPTIFAQDYIDVAMNVSNKNSTKALITINSVLENNFRNSKYHFYILHNKLSIYNITRIKLFAKKNNIAIDFINVNTDDLSRQMDPYKYNETTFKIQNSLLGLFLPELLPPDKQKIIYLNSNSLVLFDLKKLYNTDIQNYGAAMGKNNSGWNPFYPVLPVFYDPRVMLVNLDFYRKNNITSKMYNYLRFYYFLSDLDAINLTLSKNIKDIRFIRNADYNIDDSPSGKNTIHVASDKDTDINNALIVYKYHWQKVSPLSYKIFQIRGIFGKKSKED